MTVNNGISFYKMQGTGNDFVIFNKKIDLNIEQIKFICNRHYGVGCDQLIVIEEKKNNIIKIRIFNSDGSQAFSCGNGIRCIGLLMKIIYGKDSYIVKVAGGNDTYVEVREMYCRRSGLVYVELGHYSTYETDDGTVVNIGNKHLIIELDKIDDADMGYGKYLSEKLDFNLSFVETSHSEAVALTYERGAGLTNACGSAAAAIYISKKHYEEMKVLFKNSGETVLVGGREKVYIIANAKLIFKGKLFL
jgi:diaminopimelate epimerase